jgi:ABC-type branched-subunit amino acid transport system substrate-binding protein/DNA-binding beta-propeller fold protein YncE
MKTGTTFAGYRMESLIGRGGMGVVYRATDLSLERPVALKLIAPELAEDEGFRARFLREPRLAASLDHPNVIPIYEAGERDGQLYLAMRFVDGSDLKTVLEHEGKLAPERALAALAQVASALDAAHRRALVHRDVKPANVLLDEEGHVYLTDFGITKQMGGESTDTGRVVGTLDYLAPEQIRGEPVDGRTDSYALACVLYECLAGVPPFRRATEAETLWAHMQEEPPAGPGRPALDPVLRKALAKDPDDRYPTCSELIEAAAAALGLGTPRAVRRPLVPHGLRRRGHVVLAGGLVLLAAVISAAIVVLTTSGDARTEPLRTGVAAIDPAKGEVVALAESESLPGNIAAGEGAVWVLNDGEDAISRIDPQTKEITGSVETRGTPSQLAVGAGALWVGNGGGRYFTTTVSISRVDLGSRKVTRPLKLPDTSGGGITGSPNTGYPQIAVGAGAVWARNPDATISRIDPETGELDAVIDVSAATVAAGEEGVWFVPWDRPAIKRIDPRTNRVAQTIPIGANALPAIAVGAGSVWATAEDEGVVWRIEPGPRPIPKPIEVGVGVGYIAFGDGAAWAANYIDGTVSRIDPRTNAVTARVAVGAPRALAAGEGSAWVSVAGATEAGALPSFACDEVLAGGRSPDLLVASDLPLHGPDSTGPRAMADAIQSVIERHGFRAGRHSVGYASCDDTTSQSGSFELRRCAANANAYAHAERLVAVIGPYSSGCAEAQIPSLNRAPGGPLAMVSPSNSHPHLTKPGFAPDAPEVFYPTGERNYARLSPTDDLEGAALALLATQLGLESVYLIDDGVEWDTPLTDSVPRPAERVGLTIAGAKAFDPEAKSFEALANEVARSDAQGVMLHAFVDDGGDRVLKALRARLGPRVPIMATSGLYPIPDVLDRAGRAAHGLYAMTTDLLAGGPGLTPAARRIAADLGSAADERFVLHAAQAAEVVLAAIARSDGTRAAVLRELQASRVRDGILGTFRFDGNGDITPAKLTVLRVTGRSATDERLPAVYEGATIDRVLEVPTSLTD